jgi:hypothetical protein
VDLETSAHKFLDSETCALRNLPASNLPCVLGNTALAEKVGVWPCGEHYLSSGWYIELRVNE